MPYIQKTIIRKCNEACKTVITATQMLDSMIRNPRPTRAEVTDVANAVYDGTDAVMLSGETAMGKYPVEAVKMMATIVEDSESHLDYAAYRERKVSDENMKNISNAVCFASVSTAHDLGATAIIAPSISGFTTRMLSKWRPSARIIGMSPRHDHGAPDAAPVGRDPGVVQKSRYHRRADRELCGGVKAERPGAAGGHHGDYRRSGNLRQTPRVRYGDEYHAGYDY